MTSVFKEAIQLASQELFNKDVEVILSRPEEQFGDYSTNVALKLSQVVNQPPRDVAAQLVEKLRQSLQTHVTQIEIAGPGFINFRLNDQALVTLIKTAPAQSLAGQVIVAEYSDPNPFKILHVGHAYTTIVGDAIANLMAKAGGEVHRVNFGGDVGLHVGKTMWAILRRLGGENPHQLEEIAENERAAWLSAAYVEGNEVYDTNEDAKAEIIKLNKQIYAIQTNDDHDAPLAQIYWTCREWSYAAFDAFYARLGTKMEKYYPESATAELGLQLVNEHIGDVFERSEGAVIFDGEKYGLHTRVFINSEGLPTYEAKDVGLIVKKYEDYHFDRSVVITANEQYQYMTVVLKAIEQFRPELAQATTYIPHGMVKLVGGVKMSSRKGNIISAQAVLDITAAASQELVGKNDEATTLGAVKYAFLKNRIGSDFIYEPKESVSLEGNSGPYLQYAHARARSILSKADHQTTSLEADNFEAGERSLLRKLSEYSEAVDKAVNELMPHYICTYIYELAQEFNRFYEHHRVIGDERQEVRLALVSQYAETLRRGLELLAIPAPDKM